jgi:hypothetical protein
MHQLLLYIHDIKKYFNFLIINFIIILILQYNNFNFHKNYYYIFHHF